MKEKNIKDYKPLYSLGIDKKCPVCKKMFILYDSKDHVYRISNSNNHSVPVCSWKCLRDYEKKHTGKAEARKKRTIERQLQGIKEGY